MIDLNHVFSQISPALIAAGILYIAKSINTLNQRMAVVVEQLVAHDKRLERLELVESSHKAKR